MSDHCTYPPRSSLAIVSMAEERRPLDGYQEFVEPRQLILDNQDLGAPGEEGRLMRQESDDEPISIHDPLARPYADLESTRFPSPGPLPDTLDLDARGDGRGLFLWSGDYGPSMMDTLPEFPALQIDDWTTRIDERQNLGYDTSALSSLGFSGPFPGMGEILGHPPSLHPPAPALPPLHSFAPLSPFPYDMNSTDVLQPPSHLLHSGHPELSGGSQLPLLPSLGNYVHGHEDHRILQGPPPLPTGSSSKKARVDKRNTKPLTVEDLLHDNSRFAKVVKAFLSIEDQENRTVPEIAKRVSEMYSGQYADFEGVKRMVNDVLQKHKAFWHPGRGSPYQLNLNEGRARREFPSNSRRLVRNRYDENLFYPRSKKQKKSGQPVKKEQGNLIPDCLDPLLLERKMPDEDEGKPDQSSGREETIDYVEHREFGPGFNNDEHDAHDLKTYTMTNTIMKPLSPRRLQDFELSTCK